MALVKLLRKPARTVSVSSDSTESEESDVLPHKKQNLEGLSTHSTSTSSSKQSRKFNAGWMRGRKQWLVYKPEGMYCSLCQKYDQRPYNRDVWNKQPCSRLSLQSIKRHESSASHKESLQMESAASQVQTLPSVVSPPLPARGMEQAFILFDQATYSSHNYEPLKSNELHVCGC